MKSALFPIWWSNIMTMYDILFCYEGSLCLAISFRFVMIIR
jgi:hypothetical protein